MVKKCFLCLKVFKTETGKKHEIQFLNMFENVLHDLNHTSYIGIQEIFSRYTLNYEAST